jgi:cytochrome c oxidase subunit 3
MATPDLPLPAAAVTRAVLGGGPPRAGKGRGIENARIAVVMLLATETMFFTGLVGAYLVLRFGAGEAWPPAGEPRLPVAVTALNSLFLLASAWTMRLATGALRRDDRPGLERALKVTAGLGSLFLLVQGSEWVSLLGHGLTLASSTYGATFYTLIGCHGIHVLAAVIWLVAVTLGVTLGARRGRPDGTRRLRVELCAIYWYFVVALWVVLFPLVYLV